MVVVKVAAAMRILSSDEVAEYAGRIADNLHRANPVYSPVLIKGIPRGGMAAAYAVAHQYQAQLDVGVARVVCQGEVRGGEQGASIHDAGDYFVAVIDDVVSSGETMKRHSEGADFLGALVGKSSPSLRHYGAGPSLNGAARATDLVGNIINLGTVVPSDEWVQFPWEVNDDDSGRPEDAVRRLIEWVGEDPLRPGLVDTPRRVLAFLNELRERANAEWNPTTFQTTVDDLVVVRSIPLFSLCEHHMLPYYGVAHVGYLPGPIVETREFGGSSYAAIDNWRILGLSKVARVVAQVSSGLTVQEELSAHIAEKVMEYASTESVGVITRATHTCMIMRGVRATGSDTVASCMRGRFRTEAALRAEFLNIVKEGI